MSAKVSCVGDETNIPNQNVNVDIIMMGTSLSDIAMNLKRRFSCEMKQCVTRRDKNFGTAT